MRKRIALLGSTGSIGTQTLAVADHLQEAIEVVALAAHSSIERLKQQALAYRPRFVAVYDRDKAHALAKELPSIPVLAGEEGLIAIATASEVDCVVSAMSGVAGVVPTYRALEKGKDVALANKEALILAGPLMIECARNKGGTLIPVDSEHSALFQCLGREKRSAARRLILTASGGPFLDVPRSQLPHMTAEDALCHPNWSMGKKVTIDSSTLMNKGLEVIEAHYLFGFPLDKIDVIVHPQSLVHSLVEYVDGSLLAQLAAPDMKLPIQYALTYPERKKGLLSRFNFLTYPKLEFFPPDRLKFPCLQLAYDAAKEGGTLPCFMNAGNEVLVHRFLAKELGWHEISLRLENLMMAHQVIPSPDLETLLAVDKEARRQAASI